MCIRDSFETWLASEMDELREFPEPIAADFRPENDRPEIRAWLLMQLAKELFVRFSEGFAGDVDILTLLAQADVSFVPEAAAPLQIFAALLTFSAIADHVEQAMGIPLAPVMNFLMQKKAN